MNSLWQRDTNQTPPLWHAYSTTGHIPPFQGIKASGCLMNHNQYNTFASYATWTWHRGQCTPKKRPSRSSFYVPYWDWCTPPYYPGTSPPLSSSFRYPCHCFHVVTYGKAVKLIYITTVLHFTGNGPNPLQASFQYSIALGIQHEDRFGCFIGLSSHNQPIRLVVLHYPQKVDIGVGVPLWTTRNEIHPAAGGRWDI